MYLSLLQPWKKTLKGRLTLLWRSAISEKNSFFSSSSLDWFSANKHKNGWKQVLREKKAYFPTNLTYLNRVFFVFNACAKAKIYFQRVVCEQRNWQWIFPQNVTFFVNVTLSGLVRIIVRISKTRYRWKDLSVLTLLNVVLKLRAKCVQEGRCASFHMERQRPKQSSKG